MGLLAARLAATPSFGQQQGMSAVREAEAEEQERAAFQLGPADVDDDSRHQAGAQLLERVEALAQEHQGYETLTNLCELNDDMERLYAHMDRSLKQDAIPLPGSSGQPSNCAEYVFGHYLNTGKRQKLLSLPDAFNEALTGWLDKQVDDLNLTDLRALHALRTRQYQYAGQQYSLSSMKPQLMLPAAQRCLTQAKLALMAARSPSLSSTPQDKKAQESMRQVEAQQALAAVQAQLGLQQASILPPQQLAQIALQAPDAAAAVLAFDVLAAAGDDFRRANREVAEQAWRRVIAATDWRGVGQQAARTADQDLESLLAATPLAAASAKCFSRHAQQRSLCLGSGVAAAYPQHEVQSLIEKLASHLSGSDKQRCFEAFQCGCAGETQYAMNMEVRGHHVTA